MLFEEEKVFSDRDLDPGPCCTGLITVLPYTHVWIKGPNSKGRGRTACF